VLASGLFWTLPLDDDALHLSDDGRRAVLDVEDIQVIENYVLFGTNSTPATLNFHIEWQAAGPFVDRGKDATVAPTDPAAFLARFAVARSTAKFEVSEFGFSFRSDPGVSTDRGLRRWAASATASFCSEPRSPPRAAMTNRNLWAAINRRSCCSSRRRDYLRYDVLQRGAPVPSSVSQRSKSSSLVSTGAPEQTRA
jgi:hypothetical protein